YIDGLEVRKNKRAVHARIGVQLQSTALFEDLSIADNLRLLAALYRHSLPVEQLLADVNLADRSDTRLGTLSGGQQQRLSLAAALVNDPVVVFLDEPTTGLDPQARRALWALVGGLRDRGKTIVLTTHYMEEAEVLCDRIAIMDGGHVIACDTPAGLIRALGQEATVSASIENGGVRTEDRAIPPGEAFATIAGVTAATLTEEDGGVGHRVRLQTADTQATIVGLLEMARERGLTLGDLSSTRATLEDVFIQRTGRSYVSEDEGVRSEDRGRRKRRRM
ncbi:MAG: ABC transporter ATP-binding protein, partial [Thermomicrobiales bacterium]